MSRLRFSVLVLPLLALGCLYASSEPRRDELPLVLSAVHSSGGDGPVVTSVSVFEDGRIRYARAGDKARWARLSASELAGLRAGVEAPPFSRAVEALPRGPECCDHEWIAVERERSAGTVDAVKGAPTLTLPESEIAPALRAVLATVQAACDRHFARRFPDAGL